MATIEAEEGTTLNLGKGVNTLTEDDGAAAIVIPTATTTRTPEAGQDYVYEVLQITSMTQLREELNISAGASFNAIFAGGTLRTKRVNELEVSSHSFSLMVKVKVINQTEILPADEYQLTKTAYSILEDEGPDRFLEVYGNEFVASKVTGGEFVALFSRDTTSQREKNSFEMRLEAAGRFFKVDVEARSALESLRVATIEKFKIVARGGNKVQREALKNGKEILDYALQFPSSVLPSPTGAPVIFRFYTLPYTTVTNLPRGIKPHDLRKAHRHMELLYHSRQEAQRMIRDLGFAIDYPHLFQPFNSAEAKEYRNRLKNAIEEIELRARQSLEDPVHSLLDVTGTLQTGVIPTWIELKEIRLSLLMHIGNVGDRDYPADKLTWDGADNHFVQGFQISMVNKLPGLGIQYMAHLANYGDTGWISEGEFVGTRGQSRSMQGFAIQLTGPASNLFTVEYAGQIRDVPEGAIKISPGERSPFVPGVIPPFVVVVTPGTGVTTEEKRDGEFCGTRGQGIPLMGMRVRVVPRPVE